MSQASLPTPKSSECSNGSAVGLEPDRRHSAALKPSLSSCVACRTYRLDPVQRSANRATCSIERTPNNKSDLDGRCKELQTLWDGCFSNGSSANMHWFVIHLQPARKLCLPIESDDIRLPRSGARLSNCISPVRKLMHEVGTKWGCHNLRCRRGSKTSLIQWDRSQVTCPT